MEKAGIEPRKFFSPNFLRSSDKKGIQVPLSLLVNTLLSPLYFFESIRIGTSIRRGSLVINFYDPVGAVATRWWVKKKRSIVLSHHFYLSHPDFDPPLGMDRSYFLLRRMNRYMMRSAGRVLALSFRPGKQYGKIQVVPPLIDSRIRSEVYQGGARDLCYFLNAGYTVEMEEYYRGEGTEIDIYTNEVSGSDVKENIHYHQPDREAFIAHMLNCRRIITTAGFDTLAEAFYLGIPVFVIPSANHYEQYCNALDAGRTGMAFPLDEIGDLESVEFEASGHTAYREWVDHNSIAGFLMPESD